MDKKLVIFVDFIDFFELCRLVSVVCICENKKMYLLCTFFFLCAQLAGLVTKIVDLFLASVS